MKTLLSALALVGTLLAADPGQACEPDDPLPDFTVHCRSFDCDACVPSDDDDGCPAADEVFHEVAE